ncbi:protochlorophyllide oxidoreductase [Pseudanabaena biceps]|nr:protochlorophyllide oxidoreductase [Pseudanabaena biceps]
MSESISWSTEAETKLKEVPFWGRFLVRREVEKFARGMDSREVSSEIYDLANQKWMSMSKK